MRYPLHCRRLDKHQAHDWTGRLPRRTYHCSGHVIHSLAEFDDADDRAEETAIRERREIA